MDYAIEGMIGYISYFTLGILFFVVLWSFTEKIACQIFRNSIIGRLLGFVLATYGFWYPLVSILRIPYLLLLAAVSVAGTALSRFGIVNEWSTRCGKIPLVGIVFCLVSFDILQYVLPQSVTSSSYMAIGTMASWGLLVYGISSSEIIGPVIESTGLPRSRLISLAFIVACVVFLPIEFPLIYVLMSVSAVLGTLVGWVCAERV